MKRSVAVLASVVAVVLAVPTRAREGAASPDRAAVEARLLSHLDAPLLFVKRHSYTGIHIYDTFYKWPPGGGGIYVLENPRAPRAEWKIRAVIDPGTPETLGVGVYTHPDISADARTLLFCFKGSPDGSTSIYEIGLDGRGLRRLTDPVPTCADYRGSLTGQHDVAPAYLPDGRIVFLSTRPSGLVPCNNTGVAILHVMEADGSGVHPISVNNVNEFDPCPLPDGRILFGRWEYIDKNALTIQSLWTVLPDGTQETALYANNTVIPEAILDARPVPDSQLIVGTLAKHNAPPRGTIAFIDPAISKNGASALSNLEDAENPTRDTGESCEPWALSEDVVIFSGRPAGSARNAIEMVDRAGNRITVLSDADMCLHSPLPVKPRPVALNVAALADRAKRTGRFLVQDLYQGLGGVGKGEVKWLRVIEETSRVSATPRSPNPYNQTFLVSAALAFSAKNFLGIVPVEDDGSAYFEAPAGRAIYLQALDAEGRLVQSMRSFVQAAPGTTRACIGCHEHKFSSPPPGKGLRKALRRPPSKPIPESWGTGFLDYPSMVQPILDRRCVECHGGAKGIAAGLDLTGGWTEHFNISYENLANRRESQLRADLIAGIDCMNGTAHGSCSVLPPRAHGSGAAPLARLLLEGHGGRIPGLTRTERDLLLAWIDTNGLYYGSWEYTKDGYSLAAYGAARQALVAEMEAAGCARCHGEGGKIGRFESDWFNLRDPELSRILRAPLAKGERGLGLGLCRERPASRRQRIRLLVNGYAHAVIPIEGFPRDPFPVWSEAGDPVPVFASAADPRYVSMLGVIGNAREASLAAPRIDMPGAEPVGGACRQFIPPPLPTPPPAVAAEADEDGIVRLSWERSARTIGLEAEVHRAAGDGVLPGEVTLLVRTNLFAYVDRSAPAGRARYAVVFISGEDRGEPVIVALDVPAPKPPAAVRGLTAKSTPVSIRLQWEAPAAGLRYHVERARAGDADSVRITAEPIGSTTFVDVTVEDRVRYEYAVRAVSARGISGDPSARAGASATAIREPVLTLALDGEPAGMLHDGSKAPGQVRGPARSAGGVLDLRQGGHLAFPHREEYDLSRPIAVECRVRFEAASPAAVIASCGEWQRSGWFLQRLGERWRWSVGGIDCDGGTTPLGTWIHLLGTFDGRTARLWQNGEQVAEATGAAGRELFRGDFLVGQYSAAPGPSFQMLGEIAGLRIFNRVVDPKETASAGRGEASK